jgi:anaerobic ribonucleoside-triphosphate reductase activating protein
MLSFEGGQETSVGEVLEQLQEAQASFPNLEGITLLGGEPFAHAAAGRRIAMGARRLGLSVMVFSGYRWEELKEHPSQDVQDLLAQTDLLIDGRYEQDQPDHERRWIGSTNQRIHCLSDRYSAEDPCWREPNTLEIRLENQTLTVNGFPASSAIGLWKRPSR